MNRITLKADDMSIVIDTVTRIEPTYSKSVSTTPLLSYSAADAVSIETGSMEKYNIRFTRIQPENPTDTYEDGAVNTRNSLWVQHLYSFIDRWQADTDGVLIAHDTTDNYSTPDLNGKRGYIKSVSVTVSEGELMKLDGTIQIDIGTMYVSNKSRISLETEEINSERESISITTSDRSETYLLLYPEVISDIFDIDTELSFIDSFTLTGGMNDPFECLTMIIPEERLPGKLGELFDKDMVPGRNEINLNCMGNGTYTLAKCKLSNHKYTVTAYVRAERLRGYALETEGTPSLTALSWIETILNNDGGDKYGVYYPESRIIYSNKSKLMELSNELGNVSFEDGENIWQILQQCALMLDAKIFFAGQFAYVVQLDGIDRGDEENGSNYPSSRHIYRFRDGEYGSLNLYSTDDTDYLYGGVAGATDVGYEGIDTVVNIVEISWNDMEPTSPNLISDVSSVKQFGGYRGSKLNLDSLSEKQATAAAENYIKFRREPQRSMTFTVKEMHKTGSNVAWKAAFPPVTYVDELINMMDQVRTTNMSVIPNENGVYTREPRLLVMSNYERQYPEGITTYTFGSIAPVDLSSSTSQIMTSINS